MNIRLATINDIEKIAENNILLAKESENLDISYNTAVDGVKSILSEKNKGFYIVAEDNEDLLGELMITYEWSDWRSKNMWWIQSAYVKKSYRRKGVFKKLVNETRKMADKKGIDIIRLYVHNNNKDAMKVYEKIGMNKHYSVYEFPIKI